MRAIVACLLAFAFVAPLAAAEPAKGLEIYFIDTEGGAATLMVTPAGESVLVDCGNPGTRDAERIHKAATELAGLKSIDHLVISHWHSDHYGGVARLAKLMPIKNYYDHGIPEKLDEDPKGFPLLIQAYKEASAGKSKTLKVGDEIVLKQTEGTPALKMRCLCASGEVLAEPEGAKENPIAKEHKPKPEDKSDNARSLGFLVSFGGFRFLNLGDLTWNIEHKLVSPSDKVGKVDVFQAVHHGLDISNNPVLIQTVQPRVAIFANGPRKGAAPSVIGTLRRLPDPAVIYQVHRNVTAGDAENTDPDLIANADEKCQAEGIKLAIAADGKSYVVTVGSKGKGKKYEVKGVKMRIEDRK